MTYKAIGLVRTEGRVWSMHSRHTMREERVLCWIQVTLRKIEEAIGRGDFGGTVVQADDDTLGIWKILTGVAEEKVFLMGFFSTHHMPRALLSFESVHIYAQSMVRIPATNPKATTRNLRFEVDFQDFLSRERFLESKKLTDGSLSCAELELSISTSFPFKSITNAAILQKLNRPFLANGLVTSNPNNSSESLSALSLASISLEKPKKLSQQRAELYSHFAATASTGELSEEQEAVRELNKMLAGEVKIGFKRERQEVIDEVYRKELGEIKSEFEDWGESFKVSRPRAQHSAEIEEEQKEETAETAERIDEDNFDSEFFSGMNFDEPAPGIAFDIGFGDLNPPPQAVQGSAEQQSHAPAAGFTTEFDSSFRGGFTFDPPKDAKDAIEFDFKPRPLDGPFQTGPKGKQVHFFDDEEPPGQPQTDPRDDHFFESENDFFSGSPAHATRQAQPQLPSFDNYLGDRQPDQTRVEAPAAPPEQDRPINFSDFDGFGQQALNLVDENSFFGADEEGFFDEGAKRESRAHPLPDRDAPTGPEERRPQTLYEPGPPTSFDRPALPQRGLALDESFFGPAPIFAKEKNPFDEESSTPKGLRQDGFDIPPPKEAFVDPPGSGFPAGFARGTKPVLELDLLGIDLTPAATVPLHQVPLIPLDSLIGDSRGRQPLNPFEDESPRLPPVHYSTPANPQPVATPLPQNLSFLHLLQNEELSYVESPDQPGLSVPTLRGTITPVSSLAQTRVRMSLLGETWGNPKLVQVIKAPLSSDWVDTGASGVEYALKPVALRKDRLPSIIKYSKKSEKQVTLMLYNNILYSTLPISGSKLTIRVSKALNKFQFEASKPHHEINGKDIVWQFESLKFGEPFDLNFSISEFAVKIEKIEFHSTLKTVFEAKLRATIDDAQHLETGVARDFDLERRTEKRLAYCTSISF